MKSRVLGSILAAGLACGAAPAFADAAYSFLDAPSYDSTNNLSAGFVFTASVDGLIKSLGYYDLGGDGFGSEHEMAVYAGDNLGGVLGTQAPLGAATLAAGQSGVLGANDFRYITLLTPIHIYAGQTYTIAGLSPGGADRDQWLYGGPWAAQYTPYHGFAVNPLVTIGANAARYDWDTAHVVQPTTHFSDYQFYSVNFDVAAVPEPATWGLMIMGFGGLGAMLRRRRALGLAAA